MTTPQLQFFWVNKVRAPFNKFQILHQASLAKLLLGPSRCRLWGIAQYCMRSVKDQQLAHAGTNYPSCTKRCEKSTDHGPVHPQQVSQRFELAEKLGRLAGSRADWTVHYNFLGNHLETFTGKKGKKNVRDLSAFRCFVNLESGTFGCGLRAVSVQLQVCGIERSTGCLGCFVIAY
jgi:hypothetical protein